MLLDLFEGLPFYLLWPALAAIGVTWYLLICGGLYLFLHRSAYAATAWRFKTQLQPTRADHVRGEIFDGVLSMSAALGSRRDSLLGATTAATTASMPRPPSYPLWYIPVSIFGVFVVMEVFEWAFHWACHRNDLLWKIHKHHHQLLEPDALRSDGRPANRHVHQGVSDLLDSVSLPDLGRGSDRNLRDDEFRLRNLSPCRLRSALDAFAA